MISSVAIFIAVMLAMFFAGARGAFVAADKIKIELRKKKGDKAAAIAARFYEQPATFLNRLTVGQAIASVTAVLGLTFRLQQTLAAGLGIWQVWSWLLAFLATALVMFLFVKLLSETLLGLNPTLIIILFAYPLGMFSFVLAPFTWFFTRFINLVLKWVFKTPIQPNEHEFTRDDLENFVNTVQTMEEKIDKKLFGNVLNLRDVRVRDCMVPRLEIEYIDVNANVAELVELFNTTKLSRVLVVRGDIDNVLGYVHHQQLLKNPETIQTLILEISFVPGAMRAIELLKRFIHERANIACVVDEYGSLAGIITLEDLLEEIFGEIDDEYDGEEEEYVEIEVSPTEYVFSGRLEIDYLNEKYPALQLPEGDYHTLSGYLVMSTGKIPKQGAIIEREGCRFYLEMVSNTKIETVRIKLLEREVGK